MNKSHPLQYITHENIDSAKWNRCIEQANNSRFYANDWHLDRTAIIWDALVFGDYDFVMPLPIKRKLGIKYIYQPFFCQQLGIFPSPTKETADLFYRFIAQNFRYSDVHINSENPIQKKNTIEFVPRNNFLLELNTSYDDLISGYAKNTKRNLAKANNNRLNFTSGLRLEEYIAFKSENQKTDVSKSDIQKLKSIIAFGLYKGFGEISGVYTEENKLCAAVYFCHWKNRVIYFNAASNKEGKELRAMHFLMDQFIRKAAGKNLILDFEGSMLPGVARFYEGFGAKPETYFQLKFNRLPLPLKWLKR